MPFKSEKQRKFLWAKHPEIAKKFASKEAPPSHSSAGGVPPAHSQGQGRAARVAALRKRLQNSPAARNAFGRKDS